MRFLIKLILALCAIGLLALTFFWVRSPDPKYELKELIFPSKFHRFDGLISEIGQKRGVDPTLIKAIIWRESRFQPHMEGSAGERGLMQISAAAASEWSRSEKIPDFTAADLFNPKTNIEAGTWILARALNHYKDRDNPIPFALAEYNAGRSRVRKWIADADAGSKTETIIAFPSTKQYVESVQARQNFYQNRGHL